MALDPLTAGLELVNTVMEFVKLDTEMLKTGSPDLLATYVENRLKILIAAQTVILRLLDRTPKE